MNTLHLMMADSGLTLLGISVLGLILIMASYFIDPKCNVCGSRFWVQTYAGVKCGECSADPFGYDSTLSNNAQQGK